MREGAVSTQDACNKLDAAKNEEEDSSRLFGGQQCYGAFDRRQQCALKLVSLDPRQLSPAVSWQNFESGLSLTPS